MPPSSPKVRLFTIKTAQFLMTILFLFLIYALSRQAAALVLASSASAQAAPPTVGMAATIPAKSAWTEPWKRT